MRTAFSTLQYNFLEKICSDNFVMRESLRDQKYVEFSSH